jgi:hypothetical protein
MIDLSRNLTPSQVNSMAFAVREGNANPGDARALLILFSQCVEHGLIAARNPVADRLLEHVREAFRAHLSGSQSIQSALGLVRRRGRPNAADEHMRMQMAAAVLRHRLSGLVHQEALATVEREFGWGQTIIGEAWVKYREAAIVLVRQERGSQGFTPDEIEHLSKIFGGGVASQKTAILAK